MITTPNARCLATLLSEPIQWMITPHGEGWALGWRGPKEYRTLAENLFLNYYQPAKRAASPQVIDIGDDVSYIYLTDPAAIKRTLTLFFHVHIIRDCNVNTTKTWVPKVEIEDGEEVDNGDFVYEADEIAAATLAAECADAFMTTIKPVGFIPSLPKPHADAYSMGRYIREELNLVEDYASRATA
jgi:hypothetical protein